jgi:hypothetical protein
MGVGRFSRPQRGVAVITIPDAGLYTMRHVQVPPGADVLQHHVPGIAVGVFIGPRCIADEVEVTY